MLRRLRNNIVKYFLLVLFLAFFGSTNFFNHIHVVDGVTIVHSHPGLPSHRHTQNGFHVIHLLTNFIAAGITLLFAGIILLRPAELIRNVLTSPGIKLPNLFGGNPLRGPPAIITF
jgi:hypothetical protein